MAGAVIDWYQITEGERNELDLKKLSVKSKKEKYLSPISIASKTPKGKILAVFDGFEK